MRRFGPGPPGPGPPPPPEYQIGRPPPPPDYQRDQPLLPPEYRRDHSPPPLEYRRKPPPLPPDFQDDYPPPPPPPGDLYEERYHREPPPPWDDPRRDYMDAPPRGYYRQPPPPRDGFRRDFDAGGYDRGHYHPREGLPSPRVGGHHSLRGLSHTPALQRRGRGGILRVPGRGRGRGELPPGRGRGDHAVTLRSKLNGTEKSEKNSTAAQNGPSSTTFNQTSAQVPKLKSALKRPGTQKFPSFQKPDLKPTTPSLHNSGLQNSTAVVNPGLQNSALQNPGLQQVGLQKPALQNPGLQEPVLQNPGLPQSGLQKPALQNPGLQQAALQKPALQNPGLQEPVLQNPGLPQSGLQKPALQNPGLQKPVLQNPGLPQSGLQKPVLQNPGLQQPGFQKPALQNPGLQKAVLQNPGFQQPGSPSGFQKPAMQNPGLQKPDLQNPGRNTTTWCFTANQGQVQKSNVAVGNGSVKVPVPGDTNFISFKNSLQEHCQKKHLPVPSYTTFKNGGSGFSSRVEVSRQHFKTSGDFKDRKEADQNAAFTALKGLGLIPPSVDFKTKPSSTGIGVKRPRPGISAPVVPVVKKVKVEANTPTVAYKSKLNEFCQKFHLPTPKYETVRNSSQGFMTTMVYNGKVYQSTSPQITKKLAEENAAQLVLSKLNQAPPPVPSLKDAIQSCIQISSGNHTSTSTVISAATLSTSTMTSGEESMADLLQAQQSFVVSYKNQLQEHCQKKKIEHPVYESVQAHGMFGCKLTVEGKTFTSSNCKTRKGSEQSAARLALQVLGPLPPAPV